MGIAGSSPTFLSQTKRSAVQIRPPGPLKSASGRRPVRPLRRVLSGAGGVSSRDSLARLRREVREAGDGGEAAVRGDDGEVSAAEVERGVGRAAGFPAEAQAVVV